MSLCWELGLIIKDEKNKNNMKIMYYKDNKMYVEPKIWENHGQKKKKNSV